MKLSFHFILVLCVSLTFGCLPANAQEKNSLHPLQPSDTTSPRATLISFIDSCNELYALAKVKEDSVDSRLKLLPIVERIKDCLDLSELPKELQNPVGVQSAVYLKEVIDRIELPPLKDIPDVTSIGSGKKKNGLASWRIPDTRLEIVRIQDGPNQGKYLFSTNTVREASMFYTFVKKLPYRTEDIKISPDFYSLFVLLKSSQPAFSANTSSPRGTLILFLKSTNELYEISRKEKFLNRRGTKLRPIARQIFSCLDLSKLPENSRDYYAGEAAVCLKEVLDRVVLSPPERIPGPENIDGSIDGKSLVRWQIPNTQITIARVEEGPRRGEYLFSPGSVHRAVEMYEKVKNQPYQTDERKVSKGIHDWWLTTPGNPVIASWVDWLPSWFRNRNFGLAIWQWLGLLFLFFIGLCTIFLVYRIGRIRSEYMREKSLCRYWITLLFPITALLVPLGFKYFIFEYLSIRGNALYVANFSADIVFLIALIAVIIGISNRITESIVALPHIRPQGLDAHLIRIICRVMGIGAAVIVFLEGGRYLGFPLGTLLASAGIGGLAIALAAQGMIKGLFGTVTILLDKPFRVGERIIVKGQDGIVEEIGLHSTKIRTILTNHLVSIPNDQMADSEIENVGQRKNIRRTLDLHIPLDTPREKIKKAVNIIRAELDNHEGMNPEFPPRVYFNEFNDDSFNIRAVYWYHPPDFWKFHEFSEKLNFKIFQVFEENKIQFSLPSRHSYWNHDDEKGPLEINIVEKS